VVTDLGVYKCDPCGKLVRGFEKGKHEKEKDSRKRVEWKKMR
jgi:hypothetical protein